MTKIKICGITSIADAVAAVEAGADYLGFVFAASPRRVSRRTAREITALLPAGITTVGVFVDSALDELRETLEECGLDLAQLHGAESPDDASAIGSARVWKAIRIRSRGDLGRAQPFVPVVSGILLDAYDPALAGGTGRTFDWSLAEGPGHGGVSTILAGGLHPGNVAAAIRQVGPDIVDVSTGVESAPGRKDHERVRSFVAAVRGAGVG